MLLCPLKNNSDLHESLFFAGYFIHDFFDMLIYDARQSLDLLLHHIVVRYLEYSLHGVVNSPWCENYIDGLTVGGRETFAEGWGGEDLQ